MGNDASLIQIGWSYQQRCNQFCTVMISCSQSNTQYKLPRLSSFFRDFLASLFITKQKTKFFFFFYFHTGQPIRGHKWRGFPIIIAAVHVIQFIVLNHRICICRSCYVKKNGRHMERQENCDSL